MVVFTASIGSVFIGSFLSYGWLVIINGIDGRLSTGQLIIGALQFLTLQVLLSGLVIIPFALTVGFSLQLLARSERPTVRTIFCGIIGLLLALLIALVIATVPIYWPVSFVYCAFYGGTLSALLYVFDQFGKIEVSD
jgi:hypothetical protein